MAGADAFDEKADAVRQSPKPRLDIRKDGPKLVLVSTHISTLRNRKLRLDILRSLASRAKRCLSIERTAAKPKAWGMRTKALISSWMD